jgi:hypothetical protein
MLISAVAWDAVAEQRAIAEVAATVRAPVLPMMRIGSDSFGTWAQGPFGPLDLALDLLSGTPVEQVSAVFRVKSSPGAFVSGELLHGAVFIESSMCPMGCWEFPVAFAVEVP